VRLNRPDYGLGSIPSSVLPAWRETRPRLSPRHVHSELVPSNACQLPWMNPEVAAVKMKDPPRKSPARRDWRGIVCQKSVVTSQRDEELFDQRYRNSNQSAREIAFRKSAGLPQASVFLISPRATDLRRGGIKRDQERRLSSLSLRKNKTAPARADETRKRRNASVCDRYFARVTAAC